MKNFKLLAVVCLASFATMSCQTTYDAYGNPRQTVDPGTAVAGAAAVGVLGYALANDNNDNHKHYHKKHYHQPRVGDRKYGYYDRYGRWRWYR